MSIEAFVWWYEAGEPTTLKFTDVMTAFGEAVAGWDPELGRLRLTFHNPPDVCDVFCNKDAAETNCVSGLMISAPVRNAALWRSIIRIMADSHAVLFFSDDTTPLFHHLESANHFPQDLLDSLGTPVCVQTPEDIIASHER